MARTYIASDPRSGKREVVVEVRPDLPPDVDAQDLENLKRRLYERHIHMGMLVTPTTAYFVRDRFLSLDFSPDSYEIQKLGTSTLFSRIERGQVASGDGLYAQVKLWLEAVTRSWWTFVPDEALPMMLPEMVGGLAQADLEEWDELLDAAE